MAWLSQSSHGSNATSCDDQRYSGCNGETSRFDSLNLSLRNLETSAHDLSQSPLGIITRLVSLATA